MNEQINQLAKQARDYAFQWAESDSKIDPKITPEQWIETYTQKFTELIVVECASKVDWILAEGGRTQGDLIKEHFGIES